MGLRKCLGRLEKTGPYRRNPSYIRWSGALDEQHSGGESDFRRLDDEGEVEEEAHEETEEEAQEDETAIQLGSNRIDAIMKKRLICC
ncbi:hypothetical protein Bca101_073550 [Brassica carinata]